MAKGIFVHRADSIYDDAPEERYQFPRRYLNRAKQYEGDWIAYYEPSGGGRAEVEAAHIKGVAEKGPDIITNGIALSGTVHGCLIVVCCL